MGVRAIINRSSPSLVTGWPFHLTITSPGSMPAFSAGESRVHDLHHGAAGDESAGSCIRGSSGVIGANCTPKYPRITFPSLRIFSYASSAKLLGIAKLMP